MLRYFFDATSIQTSSRPHRFIVMRSISPLAFALYHRSHTVDRRNTSQTSLDGRQSRAAHTHPSVQLTWRPATTPMIGIGRMDAASRESSPPARL
jgi:hypothetical protein